MELKNSFINPTDLTDQQAIEVISEARQKILKGLMDDQNIRIYFAEKGALSKLNTIKLEFIKKDLKEAIGSPLDMAIYQNLAEQLKNGASRHFNVLNHESFYGELENILRKYIEK